MPVTKTQNWQIVQQGATPVIGKPARTDNETIVASIDGHLDFPLRLYATQPTADTKLNIGPALVTAGDGSKKVPTILENSVLTTFPATTINFQTAAVAGGTVKTNNATFALPTATGTGKFRRLALVYRFDGVIDTNFSPEAATQGALQDPGVVFSALDGLPLGYIDLISTSTSAYKSATAATTIIQNADIYRFGSGAGGGGSGSGDTTKHIETLKNLALDLPYELLTPVIFQTKADRDTFTHASSTGTYSYLDKAFAFSAASETFVSENLLDQAEFIDDNLDVGQVDLVVIWKPGKIDTAATYEVSRNGGTDYEVITMTRVGNGTDTFMGRLIMDPTHTDTSDFRLRITSSAGSKAVEAFGLYYRNIDAGMMVTGRNNTETQTFNSATEKLSPCSFTLTRFMPDPDFILAICDGAVYHAGDFASIDGYKITFADNFFQEASPGRTMKIKFMHVGAGSFDNSDVNANLLAAQHLGSTDATFDRSVAGRGIMLKRPDGTLREMALDNDDNWTVLDT